MPGSSESFGSGSERVQDQRHELAHAGCAGRKSGESRLQSEGGWAGFLHGEIQEVGGRDVRAWGGAHLSCLRPKHCRWRLQVLEREGSCSSTLFCILVIISNTHTQITHSVPPLAVSSESIFIYMYFFL